MRQGKVRYIGNSNFPAWRVAEAEMMARQMNVPRFVACQDEYSLVVRDIETDLLAAAQEYDLGVLPFFPLASGLLTGKYKRGAAAPADTRFAKAPALRERYVTVFMAYGPTAGRKRDSRRDARRADRGQRQGDRMDTQRGGNGGGGQNHEGVSG